jgi:hypothetical protein
MVIQIRFKLRPTPYPKTKPTLSFLKPVAIEDARICKNARLREEGFKRGH